jgi:hypothetical protein
MLAAPAAAADPAGGAAAGGAVVAAGGAASRMSAAAPAFDQLPDSILMKLGTYLNSATQARFGQAMGRAGAAMCLGARQKSTMERKARWMAALERHDARFGEVRPATGRESVGSLMEVMRDTAPLLAEFNAREAAKAVPSAMRGIVPEDD